MIAGRLRVAANTLLFSDSPVHSRKDQLLNIHGGQLGIHGRSAARRLARFPLGAAIALLLLRDAPGSLSGTRTLGRRE